MKNKKSKVEETAVIHGQNPPHFDEQYSDIIDIHGQNTPTKQYSDIKQQPPNPLEEMMKQVLGGSMGRNPMEDMMKSSGDMYGKSDGGHNPMEEMMKQMKPPQIMGDCIGLPSSKPPIPNPFSSILSKENAGPIADILGLISGIARGQADKGAAKIRISGVLGKSNFSLELTDNFTCDMAISIIQKLKEENVS